MCTAAGRWVRSVSTVRELDRASGPLVVGRCRHACSLTHIHMHASAQLHRRVQTLARSRALHLAAYEPLLNAHLVRAKGAQLCACARERVSASVRARATRSRFRSVFARRGASPSVAASRPAKILARSVCSLASSPLSLFLSLFLFIPFYHTAALFGPLTPSPNEPLRLGLRSLFSVSVTPPKGPLPRVPFLPRAILHFDCIALLRERRLR